MNYDIFVPVAKKDYNKIKYLLKSIEEHLIGFNDIFFIVGNKNEFFEHWVDRSLSLESIKLYEEKEVLDIDASRFGHRPNWIYQQYLKMFQDVTQDLFLTVDSDVVFNRKMEFFTKEGKRIHWMGWEQNHRPYFEFQEKVLHLPRVYPHTFVNDMNFMSKEIIREMLQRNGYTLESFIEKSYNVIDHNCYPAEPEIWGQYVFKYHSDKYEFKQAKTRGIGRTCKSVDDQTVWPEIDIESTIEEMKSQDLDMFMLHSWFGSNNAKDYEYEEAWKNF